MIYPHNSFSAALLQMRAPLDDIQISFLNVPIRMATFVAHLISTHKISLRSTHCKRGLWLSELLTWTNYPLLAKSISLTSLSSAALFELTSRKKTDVNVV